MAADRKGNLLLQSAWAYYIAGNSKSAREELKGALTARPDLQVLPDFYSPDFANLAAAVRAEVSGANVPAIDYDELKRSAKAKLADGKAEDALFDLKRASTSTDPEIFRLIAEADDKLGRTADAEAARKKAADLQKAPVSSAPSELGLGGRRGARRAPCRRRPCSNPPSKALAAGDFRAASSFAKQAADADPKSAEAHRILGDAALAAGQNTDAEREFTAAIVLESANFRAELGLGVVAERQKKWNTAAAHYRRSLDLDSEERRGGAGTRPFHERARRQERGPHRLRPGDRDRSRVARGAQRFRRLPLSRPTSSTAPSRR